MRVLPSILFALALLLLPACSNTPCSGVYAVPTPTAAASACGCGAAEAAAPGPLMVAAGGPMLGQQYSIGPTDYVKAGALIPAEAIVCVGNFAKCLTNVFFPTPTPSLGYVNVQPVQIVQPAAAPAKACAPPPPPPPVLQRAVVPAPKQACPEPVTMVPETECVGGVCRVPGH